MKRLIVILLLILPTLLFSQQLTNDEINWLKQGRKELIEIIKLNKFKIMAEKKKGLVDAFPMFNYMFLTCDRKPDKTESGIIISANAGRGAQIEMKQDVIKCGDGVRTLKPGYSVEIDPRPYFVKDWVDQNNPTINEELHKKTVGIAWPIEKIDGVELMVVPDNHIRMYWKNGLE